MKKRIYEVTYIVQELHDGQCFKNIKHKVICDTIENIKNKYSIYYLTDIDGNVIIDNRKE